MKSEEVVLVASAGVLTGVMAKEVGLSTGSVLLDVLLGAAVAVGGWYMKEDGISDFVEASGIGYVGASVL